MGKIFSEKGVGRRCRESEYLNVAKYSKMPYFKPGIGKTPVYGKSVVRIYLGHMDCKTVRKQLQAFDIPAATQNGEGGCFIKTTQKNAYKMEEMWETRGY